jgi:prepilin-type processing-associated H-X9-DG protein
MDNEGAWGDGTDVGPCEGLLAYPSGWGGDVTDSIAQYRMAGIDDRGGSSAGAHKTFIQTIGTGDQNFLDAKLVQFSDVAHVPVCADSGMSATWLGVANIAYPDICCAECAGTAGVGWDGWISADCPNGDWCPECADMHAPVLFTTQGQGADWKKTRSRHLGGSNIGWADGHATWVHAQRLFAMADEEEIEGVGSVCGADGTSLEGYRAACGEPPAGMDFLFMEAIDWYGKDTIK